MKIEYLAAYNSLI